jgi:hypothetical protein
MDDKPKRLRINAAAVRDLKAALAAARMEECAVADEHKQAFEIYLRTWVVGPLQMALDVIEGRRNG